jgi:hypothetical protein
MSYSRCGFILFIGRLATVLDIIITSIRKPADLQPLGCLLTIFAVVVFLWRAMTGSKESDRVVKHVVAISWESASLPSLCMVIASAIYHGSRVSETHVLSVYSCSFHYLPVVKLPPRTSARPQYRKTIHHRSTSNFELPSKTARKDEIPRPGTRFSR